MSLDLPNVVVYVLDLAYVFGLAVGVLTIVFTLLHRAGITWWFISPHGFRGRPVPVGAYLLWGAGMVLLSGVHLIPTEHRRIWVLVLDPVAICLFIASGVLWLRKPVIPSSSDT